MKVFILTFLVSIALTKTVEKHYHFHLDGLYTKTQRALLQIKPDHKSICSNVWCFLKNPFNKDKRAACVDAVNAEANKGLNANLGANTTVGAHRGGRALSDEKHLLMKEFKHKINFQRAKCWRFFYSKAKRQRCFDEVEAKLAAKVVVVSHPSHRGFCGRFKCLVKYLFYKSMRDQCYQNVKDEDNNKNATASLENDTSSKTSPHRLSVAHKHVYDSTKCFFRYMFNSKKRAECKAKAEREAAKKIADEKKAAKLREEEQNRANQETQERRVGLNAKGKARHNTKANHKRIYQSNIYF